MKPIIKLAPIYYTPRYKLFQTLYEVGDEKYEEATEMKMEIVAAMEKELILENMVKSLGFSDAVVSVSTDSDNVNVFINSAELNYDTALSIYSMMKNETGIVSGNVIIMPVYAESWKKAEKISSKQ